MYTIKGYVYDDENLAFIPKDIYKPENKVIIDKYSTNKGEYEKIESLLKEKKAQECTLLNKFPLLAGIAVTYDCQLRCTYCANNSTENNLHKTDINDVICFVKYLIKNAKIRKIIDKDVDGLTIYLTGGGEPTYDWDLFCNVVEAVQELCNKEGVKYKFNLTTNGILTDKQIEYVSKNINTFMVSFDGLPRIQNKNRHFNNNIPSSDYVINTMKKFDEYGIEYTIRSTLWHDDLQYLTDMFHYIYDNFKNFGVWSINILNSAGRSYNYNIKNKEFNVNEFFDTYINIYNEAAIKYGKANLGLFFVTNTLCAIACGLPDANSPFLFPDKKITICVDGADISPVVGKISNNKVVMDTYYSKELFEVYYDKYYECKDKDCIAFRFCTGGCPIKYMRVNNIASFEFECAVLKKYYMYIFNKVLEGEEVFGWYGQKIHIKELGCDIIQLTSHELESDRMKQNNVKALALK